MIGRTSVRTEVVVTPFRIPHHLNDVGPTVGARSSADRAVLDGQKATAHRIELADGQFVFRVHNRHASRAELTAGSNRPTKTAMTEITTSPPVTPSSSSSCSSRHCVVRSRSEVLMVLSIQPARTIRRRCGHTGAGHPVAG